MTDKEQAEINDPLQEILNKHARELGLKFDTVQIVATQYDPGGPNTVTFESGVGNWFARVGSVEYFLLRDQMQSEYLYQKSVEESEEE